MQNLLANACDTVSGGGGGGGSDCDDNRHHKIHAIVIGFGEDEGRKGGDGFDVGVC